MNRVFHPDVHGTARHVTELAEDLVAAGHAVTVVAGDHAGNDPTTLYPPRDTHRGIAIHRVRTTRFNRQRVLGWAVNALSFYPGALWRILRLPRHDVTVFLTDPPMLFALGPLVRLLKRTRFVCWAMDLYPDVAVEAGVLRRGSLTARLFGRLAAWALRRADRVIALGEVMAERLESHGVPAGRISVSHNWTDGAWVRAVPPADNLFAREFGLAGRFVVAYAGNMGLSHEFRTLLDAARRLPPHDDTVVLFMGGGKQADRLREETRDLPRVRFAPFQPEDRLGEALSAASVQVVTLQPGMAGALVPSKFYSALAVARPVLFIGPAHSEPAQLIARSGCGIHVEPGDIPGVLAALTTFRSADGPRMGAAGHALFLREFTRPLSTSRLASLLTTPQT